MQQIPILSSVCSIWILCKWCSILGHEFRCSDVLFGLGIQFQWCSGLDYGCPTALSLPFKEDNIPIEIATIMRCCVSDPIVVGLTPTYAVFAIDIKLIRFIVQYFAYIVRKKFC